MQNKNNSYTFSEPQFSYILKDKEGLVGVEEREKNIRLGMETGLRKVGEYGATCWKKTGLGSAAVLYAVSE